MNGFGAERVTIAFTAGTEMMSCPVIEAMIVWMAEMGTICFRVVQDAIALMEAKVRIG
jgi:hypothetical protein